jgi:hypothetical protein
VTDFKKTIATAKAKVADANTKAFMARLEAIDEILTGAPPHDVLMLCAHALAAAAPLCCEAHQDEFRTEFLRALGDCITILEEEEDAAEADGDGAPAQVH